MTELEINVTCHKLVAAICKYDNKESKKKFYNKYACGIYMKMMGEVRERLKIGQDLRSVIITCFLGRLCDNLLRSVGLPVMTLSEAKRGLDRPLSDLPEID